MLSITTTEKLTGLTVSGTFGDLNALYDALTNVIGQEGFYQEYYPCQIRVLGLCYEIRHAYQGDRNIGENVYEEEVFSFEYLWPEMLFVLAVLEDFIRLSEDDRCWLLQEGVKKLFFYPETRDIMLERIPDDVAFLRYFQNLIKNALWRTIDEKRYKKIMSAFDGFSYSLINRHFKDFCPQWIDFQNVKYLKRAPEKREIISCYHSGENPVPKR